MLLPVSPPDFKNAAGTLASHSANYLRLGFAPVSWRAVELTKVLTRSEMVPRSLHGVGQICGYAPFLTRTYFGTEPITPDYVLALQAQ